MKRNVFLKILSALSLGMVGFPLVFSSDVNCYGAVSWVRILLYYGAFLLLGITGYILGPAFSSKKLLRTIGRIIGILCFGFGLISLLFGGDFFLVVALGLNSVFWYFIGKRSSEKVFADVFPLFFMGIYIALSLICYISMAATASEEIKTVVLRVLFIDFLIELSAAALLVNQSGIYERANRRRDTRATLPKGLSGYNALLVGTVAVVLSIVCIFAGNIAEFLRLLIGFIVKLYFDIISIFNAEKMSIEASEEGEIPNIVSSGESFEWWQIVSVIALVALLFAMRKKIAGAIKYICTRIAEFLSKENKDTTNEEFYDIVEDYDSGRKRVETKLSDGRLMKLYKNEKDLVIKYRFGYRIILRNIKSYNPALMPSDTTGIQVEKGERLYGYDGLSKVAKCYERLRYNDENITEKELSALDSLIRKED